MYKEVMRGSRKKEVIIEKDMHEVEVVPSTMEVSHKEVVVFS